MGYGFYFVSDGRPAGYVVLATCDKRGCNAEISRGLGSLCGTAPHARWSGDPGCGMYFCGNHLGSVGDRGGCPHRRQQEATGIVLSDMEHAPNGDYCLDRIGHDGLHAWADKASEGRAE